MDLRLYSGFAVLAGPVAEPRHDHHRDLDAVEGGARGADHRMMRSGKAEDAVRAHLVRILRRYFDWGLSILVTEFETSHGAVDLRG